VARTIVVGGGISGIACAASLNRRGHAVTLMDKGRVLGGRMASRRIRDSGTPSDGHVVDIGASYFTAQDDRFRSVVERLIGLGIARAWTDTFHVASSDGIIGVKTGPVRYTSTGGLRSIVEHLAGELPDTEILSARDAGPISVEDGALMVGGEGVDAVAVCMPSPQARQILDSGSPALAAALLATHEVTWEPVIAVTAVFDEATWREFDGIFVNDDPVITWIANDGSRRGTGAPVLVAHVQPVLVARHLTDPPAVLPATLGALQRVLGISEHPSWADAKRWTYAKPITASPQPFFLDPVIGLGLAGDAWSDGPRVETAWLSGHLLGEALADRHESAATR
jgi:predicted NAD/FAD-dependent oxidoreductase